MSTFALILMLLVSGCSPSPQKSDPHAEIAAAWDNYRSGDFATAVRGFERARAQSAQGSDDNLMALYGLGTTWDLRRPEEDRGLAETYYRKVAELGPKSDLAAWSLFAIARMKHLPPIGQEPDYAAVRAAYQEVIDRYPDHPAAEEAFLYLQTTWLATFSKKDAQTAKEALENYLRMHPQTKYRSSIYGLIGSACATLGQAAERTALSIKALESIEIDPTNPKRDKSGVYWSIATDAEFNAGDFDTARAYYNKLIQEYPIDQRVFPAQLALARMNAMEAKIRAESEPSPTPR